MKPIIRRPFLPPARRHSARPPAPQALCPCSYHPHSISTPCFLAFIVGCMFRLPVCEDPASGGLGLSLGAEPDSGQMLRGCPSPGRMEREAGSRLSEQVTFIEGGASFL